MKASLLELVVTGAIAAVVTQPSTVTYYSRTIRVLNALTTPKTVSTLTSQLNLPSGDIQPRLDRLVLLNQAKRVQPDRLNPNIPTSQEDTYERL